MVHLPSASVLRYMMLYPSTQTRPSLMQLYNVHVQPQLWLAETAYWKEHFRYYAVLKLFSFYV